MVVVFSLIYLIIKRIIKKSVDNIDRDIFVFKKHEKDKWVWGGESSGYVARKRRIMA